MVEIVLQWIVFTVILVVYVFGLTALIFKVGDIIDEWRKNRRKK